MYSENEYNGSTEKNPDENSSVNYGENPGEIPFDNAELIESRKREALRKSSISGAKRAYSRLSLGTVLMTFLAYAVVYLIVFVSSRLFPSLNVNNFSSLFSFISLNLIAMSVFMLLFKGLGKADIKKNKKGIGFLIGAFCVAMFAMMAGSIVGNTVNSWITEVFGIEPPAVVEGMTSGQSMAELILYMVILPGFTEEFVFRKFIIDRTAKYSRVGAVVFSALLFGLFHGNFEQFFYAFAVGLVFGYIYTETGKIGYTMVLHGIMNICGAVIPSLLQNSENATAIYSIAQILIALAGLTILTVYIVTGKLSLFTKPKTEKGELVSSDVSHTMVCNVGFIVLLVFSAAMFIMTLIPMD